MAPQNSTLLHESSGLLKGFGLYSPIGRAHCGGLADDNNEDDDSSGYSVTTYGHDVIDRKKSMAEFRQAPDADEVCKPNVFLIGPSNKSRL